MSYSNYKNRNILTSNGQISMIDRAVNLNQHPLTIWMTGLSSAGKSTLAHALDLELYKLGFKSIVLDGDNLRLGINKDLDFSRKDRCESARRVAELAHLFNEAGLIVISALISPYTEDRLIAKKTVGEKYFVEVYLSAPIQVCEARDPKLLYQKAKLGQLKNFTGVDSPYEIPKNPNLEIDTSFLSVGDSVKILLEFVLPKIILRVK